MVIWQLLKAFSPMVLVTYCIYNAILRCIQFRTTTQCFTSLFKQTILNNKTKHCPAGSKWIQGKCILLTQPWEVCCALWLCTVSEMTLWVREAPYNAYYLSELALRELCIIHATQMMLFLWPRRAQMNNVRTRTGTRQGRRMGFEDVEEGAD